MSASTQQSLAAIWAFFGAFGVVGIALVVGGIRVWLQTQPSRSWPTAEAELVAPEVRRDRLY